MKNLTFKISIPFLWGIPVTIPLSIPLSFFEKAFRLKFFNRWLKSRRTREFRIIRFWQAVEYFSLKQIPEIDLSSPERTLTDLPKLNRKTVPVQKVFDHNPKDPLPWETQHWMQQAPKNPKKFLRFQIYGGVYPISIIQQTLEQKCGKDENLEYEIGSLDQNDKGETCIYAFQVSDEGRPLFDSFTLTSCAWAIGRTLSPGPDSPEWFSDFANMENQIKNSFIRDFSIQDEDSAGQSLKKYNVGRIIKNEELFTFTDKIIKDLNLEEKIYPSQIRIKSFLFPYSIKFPENGRYREAETEFLNSFFTDDLEKISQAICHKNYGLGFKKYLSDEKDIPFKNRIDLRQNRSKILETLAPSKFPPGCWPAKGHYPLAPSQQYGINAIWEGLENAPGILSINGPPGTGKTTLLRDMVSSIVVERARRLSNLEKPADAFHPVASINGSAYQRKISLWKNEFKGFEIVLASSNNGALKNVTLEIPGRKAIDPHWLPEIDYFPELAGIILKQPAWGLMGACLGNKSNCRAFSEPFWWGEDIKAQNKGEKGKPAPDALKNISTDRNRPDSHNTMVMPSEGAPQKTSTFRDYLLSVNSAAVDWEAAVNQFQEALRLEQEKRKEAETVYALFLKAFNLYRKTKWLSGFLRDWRPFRLIFNAYWQKKLTILQASLAQKNVSLSLKDWLNDENVQELNLPWLTPEWLLARAKIFIEALKLHKAFIDANPKIMENNLWGAIDILKGEVAEDASAEAISSAWTTLFFVVPLISTTFASFSRLFSYTGREGLGWLLIDEAGQALPQAAAGAIWRAKRTVAVGDPMQLKPVIPLPLTVQKALQGHFKTDACWIPGKTSVQELADRVCPTGITIKRGDKYQWAGMPLRVHRRCELSEFTLSNTISYGGFMIFGTPQRSPLNLLSSRWIDIKAGDVTHNHWIASEGQFVITLLSNLKKQGVKEKSVFIISPFRAVVHNLQKELGEYFKELNIGTIHTTQGKEADVVILVLGGNPAKPGAKKWASESPNLLNVAITRARRRFYIVGNQSDWGIYPFFRDACQLYNSLSLGEAGHPSNHWDDSFFTDEINLARYKAR